MDNKTKNDTHTIMLLLKFGKEEYMKDLFYNGTVFMNSIQYFREFEDGELRGDKYEGISKIKNYRPGEIEFPGINFKGKYNSLQLRESYPTVLGNIYSLYCISSYGWKNIEDCKIDQRNKQFGSHCVVIKDIPKFFSLIEQKLKEQNLKYRHGFVDYYDKNKISKDISLFEKPFEFEYQKEFRFYIQRKSERHLKITIGSLEDFAEIYLAEKVIDTLQLIQKKEYKKTTANITYGSRRK